MPLRYTIDLSGSYEDSETVLFVIWKDVQCEIHARISYDSN